MGSKLFNFCLLSAFSQKVSLQEALWNFSYDQNYYNGYTDSPAQATFA